MNSGESFRSTDFDAAAADPKLIGHRLARLRRQQNLTPQEQASSFGIDLERMTDLCSCRIPWNAAAVAVIAARMGWEVEKLAGLLGCY